MSDRHVTGSCPVLAEMVDDASQTPRKPSLNGEKPKANPMQELVQRIAAEMNIPPDRLAELFKRVREMGVPPCHMAELFERILAIIGPQIEERVRKELEEAREAQRERYDDSFTA